MKYAVIELSGRQHKVSEGQVLQINKITEVKPKVLFYTDGKKTMVGAPYVSGVTVEIASEAESKGKKLKITRFKAKSRYDKTIGYRPVLTNLKVISITAKE